MSETRFESSARRDPTRTVRGLDWVGLTTWSALVAVARLPASDPVSWRYFDQAAALVFGESPVRGRAVGLHVYQLHPGYQFGPLSIVAAQVLRVLGGSHVVMAAHVVLVLAGLGTLWLVQDAASRTAHGASLVSRGAFLVAGATFLLEWDHLAIDTLHIDDSDRAWVCGTGDQRDCSEIGLVVGSTGGRSGDRGEAVGDRLPPAPRRGFVRTSAGRVHARRRRRPWSLDTVRDRGPEDTVGGALHDTQRADSVLRLVGVRSPRTPSWDRLAQLCSALALGALAFARRRWEGVALVMLAVRIMLDPSVNTYYTSGLVFGALVWDLMRPRCQWPVTTVSVAILLELPTVFAVPPTPAAILRLLAAVGAIAAVLAPSAPSPAYPDHTQRHRSAAAANQ